jgi:hypothetical protein
VDHAIEIGRSGIFLRLTEEQYAKLRRRLATNSLRAPQRIRKALCSDSNERLGLARWVMRRNIVLLHMSIRTTSNLPIL